MSRVRVLVVVVHEGIFIPFNSTTHPPEFRAEPTWAIDYTQTTAVVTASSTSEASVREKKQVLGKESSWSTNGATYCPIIMMQRGQRRDIKPLSQWLGQGLSRRAIDEWLIGGQVLRLGTQQ